jgi:hypothetical protein
LSDFEVWCILIITLKLTSQIKFPLTKFMQISLRRSPPDIPTQRHLATSPIPSSRRLLRFRVRVHTLAMCPLLRCIPQNHDNVINFLAPFYASSDLCNCVKLLKPKIYMYTVFLSQFKYMCIVAYSLVRVEFKYIVIASAICTFVHVE